jgi:hypothetical protein
MTFWICDTYELIHGFELFTSLRLCLRSGLSAKRHKMLVCHICLQTDTTHFIQGWEAHSSTQASRAAKDA